MFKRLILALALVLIASPVLAQSCFVNRNDFQSFSNSFNQHNSNRFDNVDNRQFVNRNALRIAVDKFGRLAIVDELGFIYDRSFRVIGFNKSYITNVDAFNRLIRNQNRNFFFEQQNSRRRY